MRPLRKSREGYLLFDHRASPGLPAAAVERTGLAAHFGEGRQLELATLTCNHCKIPKIMNPLRTRERGHCPKCDRHLCDGCAGAFRANGVCRPWDLVVDDVLSGRTPIPLLAKHVKI